MRLPSSCLLRRRLFPPSPYPRRSVLAFRAGLFCAWGHAAAPARLYGKRHACRSTRSSPDNTAVVCIYDSIRYIHQHKSYGVHMLLLLSYEAKSIRVMSKKQFTNCYLPFTPQQTYSTTIQQYIAYIWYVLMYSASYSSAQQSVVSRIRARVFVQYWRSQQKQNYAWKVGLLLLYMHIPSLCVWCDSIRYIRTYIQQYILDSACCIGIRVCIMIQRTAGNS